MSVDLNKLKVEIPFKYRVQSFNKAGDKASCVAYIDARDVMNILDEVVGTENWQSDFKEVKGNLYAGLALRINGEWVWKWDCGTESKTEGEKGEASDAFKRASVKWGVGRFLYDKPIQWVKAKDKRPIDDKGNIIYDLTEYFKKNLPSKSSEKSEKSSKVTNIDSKLPSWVDEKFSQCHSLNDLVDMEIKILDSKPHFRDMQEYKDIYGSHVDRIDFLSVDQK